MSNIIKIYFFRSKVLWENHSIEIFLSQKSCISRLSLLLGQTRAQRQLPKALSIYWSRTPPPKLWPRITPTREPFLGLRFITTTREPFLGLRFCVFWEKNVKILNLRYYIMFFQSCSKSRFYKLKSHLMSFFLQNTR